MATSFPGDPGNEVDTGRNIYFVKSGFEIGLAQS